MSQVGPAGLAGGTLCVVTRGAGAPKASCANRWAGAGSTPE